MENASKALIMAGEILIGIMILSVGTYLFNLFAGYSEESYKQMEATQIAEFNTTFLKYEGSNTYEVGGNDKIVPIACTIHDVVGLANFAQEHNLENELLTQNPDGTYRLTISGNLDNTTYVQIEFLTMTNIERYSSNALTNFIKEYDLRTNDYDPSIDNDKTRYFKCKCSFNSNTGRVNHVTFEEFNDDEYEFMQEIHGN